MKTKLLSLNIDKSMSFDRFQARVISSLKSFLNDEQQFQQFEDIREVFVALQDALSEDDLIVTAVDTKNYLRFKNALIQAFGTDVVYNSTILNKLEAYDELDDKKRKALSMFPEPAMVFVSDDGLFSGFVLENGSQYLVVIPVDNSRIDSILRNGVIPYLSENIGASKENDEFAEIKSINNDKVSTAVGRLISSGSVVAVNSTNNSQVLKSCGDDVPNFNKVFVFTPHVEDKGDVNATEYTAQLARVSLDLSSANIGAAISDVYSSGDVKYICIAVASDNSAVVRKLYMDENETENMFVESAAVELIELIGEKASGQRSIGIEISDMGVDENAISDEDKKPAGKKPLAILAIILGVVIVVCSVIAIIFGTQGNDGEMAGFFDSLFGRETTTEEPMPSESNAPLTQAPEITEKPELLKLSDFMIIHIDEIKYGTAVAPATPPEKIRINGTQYDAKEALAKLVTPEITENTSPEALKAHIICTYTYLMLYNNNFTLSGVEISDSYADSTMDAVEAVFGKYITFDNQIAATPFHKVSAGKTADLSQLLPYLKSVQLEGNPDANTAGYKVTKEYSVDEMREYIKRYNIYDLPSNPAQWMSVEKHDSAVSAEVGYVDTVKIGSTSVSGLEFRNIIMGENELESHCFTISFNEANQRFTITSYGSGYGCGMSLAGANYLAQQGGTYETILAKYFAGATIV